MTKRFAVLSTILVAAGATLFAAAPSQAALSQCSNKYFCYWSHANYTGSVKGTKSSLRSMPSGWNDVASSWYNRTSTPWCVYTDTGYRGASFMVGKGRVVNYSGAFNDRMSSARPALTTPSVSVPGQYNYVC